MNNYKELRVWQSSVDFAVNTYKATEELPIDERYGLTSQIRRSAVSISSNIAEGAGRNTSGEFNQFLGIAYGSTCELETQLIIANRLKFLKFLFPCYYYLDYRSIFVPRVAQHV